MNYSSEYSRGDRHTRRALEVGLREAIILVAVGLVVLPLHAPAALLLFALGFVLAVIEVAAAFRPIERLPFSRNRETSEAGS